MDLDSQRKPESKLMSLVTQAKISSYSDQEPESDFNFTSLLDETLRLKPNPKLISLFRQTVYVIISINSESKKLIGIACLEKPTVLYIPLTK
ncbi:unnamed protein product, partial [Thlaspi arvense]